MSGLQDAAETDGKARSEVLSVNEEDALATLREIIRRVRSCGPEPGVEALGDEVVRLGGRRDPCAGDSPGPVLRLGGARFSLRRARGGAVGIEVVFLPADP